MIPDHKTRLLPFAQSCSRAILRKALLYSIMGFASGPHPGASYSKIEQRGDLNDSDIVETLARVKGAKSRRYCLHLSLAANTLLLALSCWLYIQSRPKDSRTLFGMYLESLNVTNAIREELYSYESSKIGMGLSSKMGLHYQIWHPRAS